LHSTRGEAVRNLKFLKTILERMPKINPIKIEKKLRLQKSPRITIGVIAFNSTPGVANFSTVLNKIIQTASLVIPSPKIRENSLGYSSYFTTAIAATKSVQQSNEHISIISLSVR
jgi:hypothetical protein